MSRIHSLDDVMGHRWIITYFKDRLKSGTLPHFIILEGPEGVGKTTLADLVALDLAYGIEDSQEKRDAAKNTIDKKLSSSRIKKFECSVDGGKNVALEILEEMRPPIQKDLTKVIVCDECHRFTPTAQDVIISNTEYLSDQVYVFMMTTDITMLQASLKSRAFIIRMQALSQKDMLHVLRSEAKRRNLNIQAEDATLSMIAEWAEYKPRTGLKILEGFGMNTSVSAEMIRGLIGVLDTTDILPLLSTLSGSMTAGLTYINEMQIHGSMIALLSEIILIKSGGTSYKLKLDDIRIIKQATKDVTTEQLVIFLEGITRHPVLTRTAVINAYINAHASKKILSNKSSKDILEIEMQQKSLVQDDTTFLKNVKAPTLSELLKNGDIVQ